MNLKNTVFLLGVKLRFMLIRKGWNRKALQSRLKVWRMVALLFAGLMQLAGRAMPYHFQLAASNGMTMRNAMRYAARATRKDIENTFENLISRLAEINAKNSAATCG